MNFPLTSRCRNSVQPPLLGAPPQADRAPMMLWTFGKDKERISLGRWSNSSVLIVVRARDEVREYRFASLSALRTFQTDMEAFLMSTGWTQLKYFPERRRDRDRRRF